MNKMHSSAGASLTLLLTALLLTTGCARGAGDKAPATHGASSGETHEAHEGHGAHEEPGHGEPGHEEAGHDEHGHEAGAITLSTEVQRKAGIITEPAAVRMLPSGLTTTGTFEANADREAHVTPQLSGRVVRVLVTVGTRVRTGQPLAILESIELGKAQTEYLQAQARHDLASSTATRQRKLFAGDLTAKKEVQAAETQLRQAAIELEAAANQLKLYGYADARITQLARSRRLAPTVAITAPMPGTVIARHLTLGEMVHADDDEPVYVISDNVDLWVNANLYERDLQGVAEGQTAIVTTTAYPGKTYRGRVTYISTALDAATRTAKARITVSNPDQRLKPQMFAHVAIQTGSQRALAIPASAVYQDQQKKVPFTFIKGGADTFVRRELQLGTKAADGFYPVLGGIKPGDQVVVQGGFTLKSELMKESFGEHHH